MESCNTLPLDETLASLPPKPHATGSSQGINALQSQEKLPILVVLDDDPTGTQTCHGISVLMSWDHQTLVDEFQTSTSGFFILTNSRALSTADARDLIREICLAVKAAADEVGKDFEFVLRGDSTLRGHFPDEPEVAEEVFGTSETCQWILAPFFRQGGRLTINDIHYVAEGGNLVPAAQTQFAKDATFGYKNSNLRKYIAEKSGGRISENQVDSISLECIRNGGVSAVTTFLLTLKPDTKVIIINATVDEDMEVAVQGILSAQQKGRRYIYRTGAAFVSTRLGIEHIAPLGPADLNMDVSKSAPGGLIIAGSYVPKTTAQLASLIAGRDSKLKVITISVEDLLSNPQQSEKTVLNAADQASRHIVDGEDVLFMTSRKLITAKEGDKLSSLDIGTIVAKALVDFLRLVNPRPRYAIAKGGITSSDAASKGLRMSKADIAGQAAAGVPLWRCHEPTSKWPGIPYVVFPGNVGTDDTLRDLVAGWAKSEEPPKMQYQRLGRSAVKVSRIILGCMSFGDPNWEGSPWILPESESLPLLKKAYDMGINTWDTANAYSNGRSEEIIGKSLRMYSIPRSKVVIMTKLYLPVMDDSSRPIAINDGQLVNQMGLSRKHIFEAVDASLRRLDTTYIDVLQLHRLDRDAEPEEIMGALHDLVKMGKVHYIAGSSMYAWEFARLQYTAKMRGWTPFTSMQNFYNLLYREEEREMNPFCAAEGIGLTPWSPLARGLLGRAYHEKTARSEKDTKTKKWFENEAQNKAIIDRVEQLAKRKGCTMAALSTAWLLRKGCAPIVGLSSGKRIEQTLDAFEVETRLTDEEMRWLEEPYRPVAVQSI